MADITVDSWEYRQLQLDAEAWRLLNSSPHVAELIREWLEWDTRRVLRDTSYSVSAAMPRAFAAMETYGELARRRAVFSGPALTPEQIRVSVAASWVAFRVEHALDVGDVAA